MIKNLLGRLLLLGVAYLCQIIGIAECGKAFFWIDIGLTVILILVIIFAITIFGIIAEETEMAGIINLTVGWITFLITVLEIGLAYLLAYVTKDFYVAYIILTFLFCFIPQKNSN